MYLEQIFLAFLGFSFGMIVSGGVFTVFVTVGLVPRFAGKTHTGKYILRYEDCICAGAVFGCVMSVFSKWLQLGIFIEKIQWIPFELWKIIGSAGLSIFGVFAGMFIGCFAIAIAEMLNTMPIFTRRVGLGEGIGVAILSIAAGKTVGSLIYFMQHVYEYGG